MPTPFGGNPATLDWKAMYGGSHVKLSEDMVAPVLVRNESDKVFSDGYALGEPEVLYAGRYIINPGKETPVPTYIAKYFFGDWELQAQKWEAEIRRLYTKYGIGGMIGPVEGGPDRNNPSGYARVISIWDDIVNHRIYVVGKTEGKSYTSGLSVNNVRIANKEYNIGEFQGMGDYQKFNQSFEKARATAPIIQTEVTADVAGKMPSFDFPDKPPKANFVPVDPATGSQMREAGTVIAANAGMSEAQVQQIIEMRGK